MPVPQPKPLPSKQQHAPLIRGKGTSPGIKRNIEETLLDEPAFSSTTPATLSSRLSIAPSANSPFATPPKRRVTSIAPLLDAYGVPIKPASSALSQKARPATPSNNVFVCVRKRPCDPSQDITLCNESMLSVTEDKTALDGFSKYNETIQFRFDKVFDDQASNQMIHEELLGGHIRAILARGGASPTEVPLVTCFAYGQTGSGKTFTVFDSQAGTGTP